MPQNREPTPRIRRGTLTRLPMDAHGFSERRLCAFTASRLRALRWGRSADSAGAGRARGAGRRGPAAAGGGTNGQPATELGTFFELFDETRFQVFGGKLRIKIHESYLLYSALMLSTCMLPPRYPIGRLTVCPILHIVPSAERFFLRAKKTKARGAGTAPRAAAIQGVQLRLAAQLVVVRGVRERLPSGRCEAQQLYDPAARVVGNPEIS